MLEDVGPLGVRVELHLGFDRDRLDLARVDLDRCEPAVGEDKRLLAFAVDGETADAFRVELGEKLDLVFPGGCAPQVESLVEACEVQEGLSVGCEPAVGEVGRGARQSCGAILEPVEDDVDRFGELRGLRFLRLAVALRPFLLCLLGLVLTLLALAELDLGEAESIPCVSGEERGVDVVLGAPS